MPAAGSARPPHEQASSAGTRQSQYSRKQNLKEPYLLTLGLRLRRWEVLPFAGGLLDQPEALMQQIDAALDAYDEWRTRQEQAQHVADPTGRQEF